MKAAVADHGAITANGGTLVMSGTVSGAGVLGANSGATVDLTAGGTLTETISGAGTLELRGTTPYGLAGGTVGIANLAVDAGTALSGTGSITGAIANAGTVTASGGERW